jgi:hypothetical protein
VNSLIPEEIEALQIEGAEEGLHQRAWATESELELRRDC